MGRYEAQDESVAVADNVESEAGAERSTSTGRMVSVESGWDTLLTGGIPTQVDEDWQI